MFVWHLILGFLFAYFQFSESFSNVLAVQIDFDTYYILQHTLGEIKCLVNV